MAKILIVDDSALILAMLESTLTQMGHSVVKVSDGYTVVPTFQKEKPDLVVLDFHMPAASGADVYQRIRMLSIGEKTPVIFLSASSPYELQYVIPEEPLVRFLQKPVDIKVLQDTVNEMMPQQPA